jgi:hypothetical protein
MRQRLLTLALALALAPVARADVKTHAAAVKKFFAAAHLPDLVDSTIDNVTDLQIRANPGMAPYRGVLVQFFRKYMSWESLEPEMIKLYMREFTEPEIVEMTRFYETPVGKKVMKKLPQLSAQGAAIGQQRVQDNMGELQNMIAEEKRKEQEAEKAAREKDEKEKAAQQQQQQP